MPPQMMHGMSTTMGMPTGNIGASGGPYYNQ